MRAGEPGWLELSKRNVKLFIFVSFGLENKPNIFINILFCRDAEPVEDESPPGEDPKEEVEEDEETPMRSDDGESPWFVPVEEGSGSEGSATDYLSFADEPRAAESETGSGESWTDSVQPKGILFL